MQTLIVDLSISGDEYLKRYKYPSAVVATLSRDGRRVQFPANILQRFVSHQGIVGSFRICFDDSGKFLSISSI